MLVISELQTVFGGVAEGGVTGSSGRMFQTCFLGVSLHIFRNFPCGLLPIFCIFAHRIWPRPRRMMCLRRLGRGLSHKT